MNGRAASTTECPTPSAWHALWAGELTADQLHALESHLDECAACAALIAMTPPTPALIREAARDTTSHVDTPDIWYLRMRTALLAESGSSPTIDMIEPESPAGTLPPSTIGDYELLERIGRGGMGIVFRARQVRLDRAVAVKTLHARTNQSPEAVERLIIEAKRLAQVRHPNIVQVFDVGEQDGAPFFSMELIEGTTVARAAREGPPWSPRRAAALVAKIADAVHVAHEAGIIHRDLKPANVLLAAGDEPKITDFGLALNRADTAIGGPRLVAGTAEYMAPEQWAGDLDLITLRTDIYGLGTILYELLAGQPPFPRDRNPIKTRQRVLNDCPLPLSAVPRDLEAICLRCLEKSPSQRYASAQEVADDLRRFLQHRPVIARPVGVVTRWTYAARRKRAQLTTVAGIVLLAAGILFGYGISVNKERRQREAQILFDGGLRAAQTGRITDGVAQFEAAINRLNSDRPDLHRFYEQTRARWAMLELRDPRTLEHTAAVTSSCVSSDGRWVLVGDAAGSVTLWSPNDGSVRKVGQCPAKVHSTAFNRGGSRCAVGCDDGTVRVWDCVSGALITECRPDRFPVDAIAMLGEGNEFVTKVASSTGKLAIWSCGTSPAKQIGGLEKMTADVSAIIPSPDGNSFLILGWGGRAWLCDHAGKMRFDLALAGGQIFAAGFSPDGTHIAVAGATVQFFDPRTEQFGAKSPAIAGGSPRSVVVRSNGEVSVVIEEASRASIRQYTPDLGSFDEIPIASLRATLVLDSDRPKLLTISDDTKQIRLARLPTLGRRSIAASSSGMIASVAASDDGRRIATLNVLDPIAMDNRPFQVALWDGKSLERSAIVRSLPHGAIPYAVAQNPESDQIAIGCEIVAVTGGAVLMGRPQPGGSIAIQELGLHRNSVNALAYAPQGRFLVSGSRDHNDTSTAEIVCWDADAGVERCRTVHSASINALAVSPDGRWLAVGDEAGMVTLLPAETLSPSKPIRYSVGGAVTALAYSSDGEQLAAGMINGQLVLLKRIGDQLTPVGNPISVGARVSAARFGADPRLLYVCTIQRDAGTTAWNTAVGRTVGPLFPSTGTIRSLAVPRAGSAIISLTTDGRLTMIPSTQQSVGP